ncbi:MAG: aldo/keto reductase [Acidobacteriota bacterium]
MAENRSVDRRAFLGGALSGVATLGLTSLARGSTEPAKPSLPELARQLVTRPLGKTGIKLPVVSMGVMNADNPALVKQSYELGVRHFDTAAYYQQGRNEEMVGSVIKQLNARDQVVIATKVYIPHEQRSMPAEKAREFYLKTTEESLRRLQTDHLDILYSHNVSDAGYLNNPGILDALQTLKKQGKTRFIGFSTHRNMMECIQDAVRSGLFDVILTSFNYAMWDDTPMVEALQSAHAKGIGLVAMKTQCSQYWYKENLPAELQKRWEGELMHTALLKWVLRHEFISTAVPGYTTFPQMETDFTVAYGLDFTAEEEKFIKDRTARASLAYCRQCSSCLPSCPRGVDIPTLMRTHMYAATYGNFQAARAALNEVPHDLGLATCASCGDCSARCIRSINIAARVEELKAIYA